MVKQVAALAPQAVARKLPPGNRQVARPLASDARHEPSHRGGERAEDEAMSVIEPGQLGPSAVAEHDGVHQASRPDEHGRPAAGSSQDRHAAAAARLDARPRLRPRTSGPRRPFPRRAPRIRSVSVSPSDCSASSNRASSKARFSSVRVQCQVKVSHGWLVYGAVPFDINAPAGFLPSATHPILTIG